MRDRELRGSEVGRGSLGSRETNKGSDLRSQGSKSTTVEGRRALHGRCLHISPARLGTARTSWRLGTCRKGKRIHPKGMSELWGVRDWKLGCVGRSMGQQDPRLHPPPPTSPIALPENRKDKLRPLTCRSRLGNQVTLTVTVGHISRFENSVLDGGVGGENLDTQDPRDSWLTSRSEGQLPAPLFCAPRSRSRPSTPQTV